MAKQRKFSPEFKAKIALASLRKESTTSELCRKHQLSNTSSATGRFNFSGSW
ncbi:MAG: transposase [Planctomycetes bacterium]|nr:transposase [Planctomycetota bacterium]